MAITVVPEQAPGQREIVYAQIQTPYSGTWWAEQAITNVPTEAIGWFVGQGWFVTNIGEDNTTEPSTFTYDIYRETLNNWKILQSLLDSYVIAYNDAVYTNAVRYNDVVENWTSLVATTHDQMSNMVDEQVSHVTTYLANLDTYMSAIELLISDNETAWDTATAAAAALLAQGQTEHDAFDSAYQTLLSLLEPDWLLNAGVTRGLLEGLGTTELARITEEHVSSLATQIQDLTDRGLYSSVLITDITTRNTREKSEAIGAHYDRLAREKIQNEHTLYGQLVSVRDKLIAGTDRLEVLTQEVLRWRHARTVEDTQAETAARDRAMQELMNTAVARQEGLASTHEAGMKLMQWSLDEQNKVITGLYGFVERREDAYPSFENLVQLVTGLGDAGGSFVMP